MARYNTDPQYLVDFLQQYRVPELKQLANLIVSDLPKRKADIETFLQAKSGNSLPNPVTVLLTETAERITGLQSRGEALLIEAKDPVLAQLIVNDGKLRSLCLLAGEQTIVVPKENEAAFRRKLRQLGYGVSA